MTPREIQPTGLLHGGSQPRGHLRHRRNLVQQQAQYSKFLQTITKL